MLHFWCQFHQHFSRVFCIRKCFLNRKSNQNVSYEKTCAKNVDEIDTKNEAHATISLHGRMHSYCMKQQQHHLMLLSLLLMMLFWFDTKDSQIIIPFFVFQMIYREDAIRVTTTLTHCCRLF